MKEALSQWGYAPVAPVSSRELERRARLTALRRAQQLAKTHCPHGHPYSPENTRVRKSGARICRTCSRASNLKSYHKYNPTAERRPKGA